MEYRVKLLAGQFIEHGDATVFPVNQFFEIKLL